MQAWKQIENEQLSADGSHALYTLKPDVGDAETVIYNANTKQERRFPRLEKASFTYDGSYLIGLRKPSRDTVLYYKRKEKGDDLKKMDSLLVWDLQQPEPTVYPSVYDYKISERHPEVFAYTRTSLLADSLRKELDKDAKRLVVRRFAQPDSFYLEGVMEYAVARDRPIVVARRTDKDSSWAAGVLRIDPEQVKWQTLSSGPENYAGLTLSYDGNHVAFLSSEKDEDATQQPFHLHYWSRGSDSAYIVTGPRYGLAPQRLPHQRRPSAGIQRRR